MKKFEEYTSWGGKKSALLRERGHRCEVCSNCHAQTPTFGGANKGKHPDSNRRKIMKRYIRSS